MDWNSITKGLLKAELVKRGITHDQLVNKLNDIGVKETKSSVDSKISRGTFSAVFLIQCLNAIGCEQLKSTVDHSGNSNFQKILQ